MKKNQEIIAYKGFDKNFSCRGYQYEVGKTFEHQGSVKACNSGFHACEIPLNVFDYRNPADSRFAVVKCSGEISKEENGDSKIACGKLHIEAEIKLPELIQYGVDWILSKVDFANNKTTNTGYRSAATNTGDQSAATNTGYRSAATNTGYRSAATNTGDQSAATNTGCRSAASVEGEESVACALGFESKAKASGGGAIVCVFRDDEGRLLHIRSSKVGENGIKPDTWYMLDENGNFIEV